MKNADQYKVSLEKLKKICDFEKELDFCNTSQDVSPLKGIIGQERAEQSMEFGLAMEAPGYHIFVVGNPGTGKSTYTREMVMEASGEKAVPDDWCYLNNFSDNDKPLAVSLPAGRGREFQKDMEKLISDIKVAILKVFNGSDYKLKKDSVYEAVQNKVRELYDSIEEKAFQDGFSLRQEGMNFIFVPLRYGRPIQPGEFGKLSDKEKQEIEEKRYSLGKNLDEILYNGQIFEKQVTEQVIELDDKTVKAAIDPLMHVVLKKYKKFSKIAEYLGDVSKDIIENQMFFRNQEEAGIQMPFFTTEQDVSDVSMEEEEMEEVEIPVASESVNPFNRYKVNLFINNEKKKGAPVVIESNPYYYNLFGKIEYKSQVLVMNTDFTMIKPGAIQQANGGFLVLQAKDILTDPFAWDALKKALKYKEAVVENIGEQYRTVPTVTLKPEPIPLDLKVILVGSPIYYMILSGDEEFRKLFKVKVDFDVEMPRNLENIRQYVSFVSSICNEEGLLHFERSGLAKIIEYGSRLEENKKKLSTRFDGIRNIVFESNFWAKKENAVFVDASHVKKAIDQYKYRFNKMEEKIQEEILEKNIIIDTTGTAIGQVNGLVVIETEAYAFGLPTRITARTYIGHSGVIHIERETEMSGNIHSKGVLTLAGYLGGKLAQDKPLSFTAQVTFEQVYEGIEGDSASSAELYAIISSLADIPLKQSLAITGSVDQRGEIQPIGGVNEKIEGFFDICYATGLTGSQGVIIPTRNVDNLMLKDEVIEAVRDGKFNIYAIENIEEGIEILSDIPAGEQDLEGNYPKGSIFSYVDKKMEKYNKALEDEEEQEKEQEN